MFPLGQDLSLASENLFSPRAWSEQREKETDSSLRLLIKQNLLMCSLGPELCMFSEISSHQELNAKQE